MPDGLVGELVVPLTHDMGTGCPETLKMQLRKKGKPTKSYLSFAVQYVPFKGGLGFSSIQRKVILSGYLQQPLAVNSAAINPNMHLSRQQYIRSELLAASRDKSLDIVPTLQLSQAASIPTLW